jgi:hypothetical protein
MAFVHGGVGQANGLRVPNVPAACPLLFRLLLKNCGAHRRTHEALQFVAL